MESNSVIIFLAIIGIVATFFLTKNYYAGTMLTPKNFFGSGRRYKLIGVYSPEPYERRERVLVFQRVTLDPNDGAQVMSRNFYLLWNDNDLQFEGAHNVGTVYLAKESPSRKNSFILRLT